MNSLLDLAGEICKIVLPIREEVFLGNNESSVAVCTLASMNLLREISRSDIMKRIAIAGRLLSENKGIDELVRYIVKNRIQTLIVCGKEVVGHKTGHALISLYRYGIDDDGRIKNSCSPSPFLTVSKEDVEKFQKQIMLVDRIGETGLDRISCEI